MAKSAAKTKTIPAAPTKPAKTVKAGKEKYAAPAPAKVASTGQVVSLYRTLQIGSVFPSPLNPRRHFDEESLFELAASIVANGMLQPILVRPLVDEHIGGEAFEIICGERRVRAARLAMRDGRLPQDYEIPARIRDCTDEGLVLLAATENLARRDMDPLEEAEVFKTLAAHITHAPGERAAHAVARVIGCSERTVFKRLQLLRLAPELQADLREKRIGLEQAAAYSVGDHETQRAHRKTAETQGEYYRSADTIRRQMTAKSFPVKSAAFDLGDYSGEIVEDDGLQYFVDTAQFVRLQEVAVAARIEQLKKEWSWVERVEERMWQYHDTGANDADAGAIVFLGNQGSLIVKAPVIRRETVRQRQEQSRRDREGAASDNLEEDDTRVSPEQVKQIRGKIETALALAPHQALAAAIVVDIQRSDQVSPAARARLAEFAGEIKAALVVPDETSLEAALTSLDETQIARLYRFIVSFSLEVLIALHAAQVCADIASEMMFYGGKPTPLGLAFAEPGLFEAPAAA